MGKDFKKGNYKQRNQQPYNKDAWKNQRNRRHGGEQKEQWKGGHKAGANKKQDYQVKVNLREDQVGITEFVTDNCGFTGVVKSRFSDFHVNEIDLDGNVVELNDLNIPQVADDSLSAEELTEARKELNEIISTDVWDKITKLAETKSCDDVVEIDVSDLDKDKRTQIHKVLKKLYAGKLVSSTISKEGTDAVIAASDTAAATEENKVERKFVKIMKPKGGRDQNRNRWTFPGEYVYFLVHKENMDTSEVASAIADRLNLRPSQVNYCGTKDKRAKTTQKFCIKRRTPSQIVGSIKFLSNVHIGNFEFSNQVLKLGDLKGNRFRIALRHVSGADQQQIDLALQQLRERGFINYFGLQRFGNCASVPTYEVGVALLKSDYKTACELILKPRENDVHFMRAIRELWWKERNSAAAAAMFRNDKFIEKKLLDGLAQYGENDYAAALRKIPRNMLLLYPHAFQSLVFNRIASRRIKDFGFQLIPGDLVYRNKNESDLDIETIEQANVDSEDVEKELTTQNIDEEGEERKDEVAKENEDQSPIKNDDTNTESVFKRKVRPLTSDDIESGKYTMFDVVLPLPGYDVTYPGNETAKWYEEILQEYDLSSEKLRHNVKTYAMAGAYRKLLIQPEEMSWKFCDYDNAESALIISDWESLRSKSKLPSNTATDVQGKFKALLMDFRLPTAVYATMLLRELLKTDTSAANQTQLEQEQMKKFAAKEGEDNQGAAADDDGKEEKELASESPVVTIVNEKRKAEDTKVEDHAKDAEDVDGNGSIEAKKMKYNENE